jgi:hypothetical protein
MRSELALHTVCRYDCSKTHPWHVWSFSTAQTALTHPPRPGQHALAYYRDIRIGQALFPGTALPLTSQARIGVTLIDPHGDLAKLVLTHLVGQGTYKDSATYERIVYLDLPAGEQQGRFLPFNPLLQDLPAHTIASNFKEAMHRAFPELSQGAAIFDTLLPRALRVLLANNLPITELEPFLWDEAFRSQLLARLTSHDAATITNYFQNVYAELRRSEQISYAGSVLRRAALLTDLPVLRYSFAQPGNRLPFRTIMDAGQSVIINLALRELKQAGYPAVS